MNTISWRCVSQGDLVDVIAPSGKIPFEDIEKIKSYLNHLGLRVRLPLDLLGEHPFFSNDDETRWQHLKAALYSEESALIWCVRGGHGATRLLPRLLSLQKPETAKLLVGFSDVTALHIFLNQQWGWPSLHAPMARQVSVGMSQPEDVASLTRLWFQGTSGYVIEGIQPMNLAAKKSGSIKGKTIGGCASLLATSLGTPWQVDTKNKIVVLEDVNELAYRLDRLLVHLANAGVFREASALIFGDLSEETNLEGEAVLKSFVNDYFPLVNENVPVYRLTGFGHGKRNKPFPLGVDAILQEGQLGFSNSASCSK